MHRQGRLFDEEPPFVRQGSFSAALRKPSAYADVAVGVAVEQQHRRLDLCGVASG
jgi:hypothetical protein